MIVSLIPVRGGSKGIPGKNIRLINGKPLVYWTIHAALESTYLDNVYVSTDSLEIKNTVEKIQHPKLHVISRSPNTSTDIASTESVMLEFAKSYFFEHIALIQATSPLLTSKDINEAFDSYFHKKADSLLTCVEEKRFYWKEINDRAFPLNYDPLKRPRRQNFKKTFVENGALYITNKKNLVLNKSRLSGHTVIHKMSSDTYFELDEFSDWVIIESLLKSRTKNSL